MNIQPVGSFLIKKIQNNFIPNKHAQNPISFKSNLTLDTVEFSAATTQEETTEQNAKYQQKKEETLKRFASEIAANTAKISTEENKKARLEQERNTLFELIENEDFLSQIQERSSTYHKKMHQRLPFDKIDTLINGPEARTNGGAKQLAQIIGENFPEYLEEVKIDKITPSHIYLLARQIYRREHKYLKSDTDLAWLISNDIGKILTSYSKTTPGAISFDTGEMFVSTILETADKSIEDLKNALNRNFETKKSILDKEIIKIKSENESLEEQKQNYLAHFEEDCLTACCYSPFLTFEQQENELLETGVFRRFDINDKKLSVLGLNGKEVLRPFQHPMKSMDLFDLRDEQNKKVFDLLDSKDDIVCSKKLPHKYLIPLHVIENMPQAISFEYINSENKPRKTILVNLSQEDTQQFLNTEKERWARARTKSSKYLISWDECKEKEIPADYLESLGFASAPVLKQLVQSGELPGRIEKVQTQEGIKFNTYISSDNPENIKKTVKVLESLRKSNKNIISFVNFAKELKISQRRLLQDITDGKVDIISEHLTSPDSQYKWIDKRNEKNKTYIEKTLFEQEVIRHTEEEKKATQEKKNARSLRMSLVWHFCPSTRHIASELTKGDGYLCSIIAKENSEDETLTVKEQIKINSYRKEMWLRSGTDELKEGFKQANIILKQYKEKGLSSIEDEGIRKIFEDNGYT